MYYGLPQKEYAFYLILGIPGLANPKSAMRI